MPEFLTVSFHQDWKDDFPDERASVRHFAATMSRSRCVAALAELDDLLAEDITERRKGLSHSAYPHIDVCAS